MENSNPGQAFLDEVRGRMRQSLASSETGEIEHRVAEGLSRLREASREALLCCSTVGSLPPQPDSLRARLSMWLVRIVRQALFWYTPQVIAYQSTAAGALETQVALFEAICRRLERAEARTAALQLELSRLTAPEQPGTRCGS
ncbi:MAG: hypothetical protein LAP87_11990 [Acidobacteriia bacterium]|nr:hypothetical protein [Terriglobia bacterium]